MMGTLIMRFKHHDETEYECIKKAITIARDNGPQIRSFILERGYSFESIISACMKAGKQDAFKPIYVVFTVRNYHPRLIPKGPWSLSVF